MATTSSRVIRGQRPIYRSPGGSGLGADAVEQLKEHLDTLQGLMRRQFNAELRRQAERLAAAIRQAAPVGPTAHLQASVRVEEGSDDLHFLVKAGGSLTTRTTGTRSYDYALGTEFGTSKERAEPFFYPTFRRLAPQMQAEIDQVLSDFFDINKVHI